MKFQIVILALALSSCMCADDATWKSYFGDACGWRASLNTQMKQLTPNGQQLMSQILLDLQAHMGAGIQPHFESLTQKYGAQMQAINGSADAASLKVVGAHLGWKAGITRGLGLLQDSCQRQTAIRAAVAQMTPENQEVVKAALADVAAGMMSLYKPVASIVLLKDKYLFEALAASENKATLVSLKSLFGQ